MAKWKKTAACLLAFCVLLVTASCNVVEDTKTTQSALKGPKTYMYTPSDQALYNPLMGFAAEADYKESVGENTLVYIEILWKDIEPEEGVFDFSGIEEKNHLKKWREAGKHAVLRFMCDKPSQEKHLDIPQWLYEKTKDGSFYSYSGPHAGYSPDYANPVFIAAHQKAIEALGKHFGTDAFVSYVELGSLGHWGEWHVKYDEGIVRMPKAAVREQYVAPYLSAFPNAKILMRRPFQTAKEHGFGLYDDTAGNPVSTADWMEWIQNGGDYQQALETNALSPMPDAWKTAPIGGEFNSDLKMVDMLTTGLNTTLSLLQQSHTTFLGPKFPNGLGEENGEGCTQGIDAVRKTLGYRIRIEKAEYTAPSDDTDGKLVLSWKNDGIAPMYWDWNVYLYFYDESQTLLKKCPVEVKTTQMLPGETLISSTVLKQSDVTGRACVVAVGVEDPMTKEPAVNLAMETKKIGMTSVLWE